jgi:acetate---CoA ligase (ADP-forming)
MLEARSVAVVGASARPNSFGEQLMLQLVKGGFDGAVYPVNPKYEEIAGLRSYPSIADVPGPVDLAILGVPNALVEDQLSVAAEAGARSAVIFSSCYETPEPGRMSLAERVRILARTYGMALCGGNGMGFLNVERGLRACGFSEPWDLEPGPITFVSHSGSAFSAMLHNGRRLRFNLVVSSGLELVTTAADYLDFALGLDSTRVIALFIETARDPDRFRLALARSVDRGVPVVVLKVGRDEQAKALVTAHSGALGGEDGAYEALFDAYGALRVESFDEMTDTLELLSAGRAAAPGGLAAIHDSGGERALLIDTAAQAGVPFARISEVTTGRLSEVVEEGLPPVNPLDAWGTGNDADEIFATCMRILLDDPDTAGLAFCVDLTTELESDSGYGKVAIDTFSSTGKPVAILSNMTTAIDPRDAAAVRAAGVPILEGTVTGLAAFGHLFAYRDFLARPRMQTPEEAPIDVRRRWRSRLLTPSPLSAGEAFELLAEYGIRVVRAEPASSMEESVAAAERVGWPVALKSAAPGLAHKSDVGGVALGVSDATHLRRAYQDMASRLGPEVFVSAMAEPGVELALGVVNDAQFGPLVMVAAGGVLVEVLRDRRFALAPTDRATARRLLDRLAVRPLLDGVRGQPGADLDAVAEAIVRLSVLADDLADLIEALDVNPLIAGPDGCVAVDALVVPKG